MAFSRVSTEDSDLPIFFDIKDEPAFKSLQGNRASFESGHLRVRSTCGSKFMFSVTYL